MPQIPASDVERQLMGPSIVKIIYRQFTADIVLKVDDGTHERTIVVPPAGLGIGAKQRAVSRRQRT